MSKIETACDICGVKKIQESTTEIHERNIRLIIRRRFKMVKLGDEVSCTARWVYGWRGIVIELDARGAKIRWNDRTAGECWVETEYIQEMKPMSQTVILRWGTEVVYKCPGCDGLHSVPVEGPKKWEWNKDIVKPTLSPSVKHTWTFGEDKTPKCCHYHIREGRIEFCGDCTHSNSGQTLPLEPFTEFEIKDAEFRYSAQASVET